MMSVIGVRFEIGGVVEDGEEAGSAGADHVDGINVADIGGFVRGDAGPVQGEPEDGGVGFFHADDK